MGEHHGSLLGGGRWELQFAGKVDVIIIDMYDSEYDRVQRAASTSQLLIGGSFNCDAQRFEFLDTAESY